MVEHQNDINWLGLCAICLALLQFQELISEHHLLIRMDNMTAKAPVQDL